jgi:hypothetical protein
MKKIIKSLIPLTISLVIFLMLIMPVVSLADGLVPCDNSAGNLCDFKQLMNLVNTIIHFALFYMAIPIAAIMFAYAGFELVSSGGSTEKRGLAKKVFTDAVIGLVLAAAAWLIIRTILLILGYDGAWIGLNPF